MIVLIIIITTTDGDDDDDDDDDDTDDKPQWFDKNIHSFFFLKDNIYSVTEPSSTQVSININEHVY